MPARCLLQSPAPTAYPTTQSTLTAVASLTALATVAAAATRVTAAAAAADLRQSVRVGAGLYVSWCQYAETLSRS